jgi:hypothetical protein
VAAGRALVPECAGARRNYSNAIKIGRRVVGESCQQLGVFAVGSDRQVRGRFVHKPDGERCCRGRHEHSAHPVSFKRQQTGVRGDGEHVIIALEIASQNWVGAPARRDSPIL